MNLLSALCKSKEYFYTFAFDEIREADGEIITFETVDSHLEWFNGSDGWGFYYNEPSNLHASVLKRLIMATRHIRVAAYAKLETLLIELDEAVLKETEELAKITASIPFDDEEEARL